MVICCSLLEPARRERTKRRKAMETQRSAVWGNSRRMCRERTKRRKAMETDRAGRS